jgi:hypothetical protein
VLYPASALPARPPKPGRPTRRLFLLLAAYLFTRAALGAAVNPSLNGPDEGGHVEYVRTLVESGGARVAGVEARQPRLYYALAALPWQATAGEPFPARLFAVRLVSAASGVAALAAAWFAARLVWPDRPLLALAAAGAAVLAPGYLLLLSSASNDPLAAALASCAVLAALRLALPPAGARWWLAWTLAAAAALATKLTAAPVILATALAIAGRHLWRLRPRWRHVLLAAAAGAAAAAYAALLTRHPTSSPAAALAHFWPQALLRTPAVFVRLDGGAGESFRTFWYAYDYGVRWPRPLELALAGSALVASGLAAAGLVGGRRKGPPLPAVAWAAAALQVAVVAGRAGFAAVLGTDLGGILQAKAFFPAIVPLALLFVAGLAAGAARAGLHDDRRLALGLVGWLLALDAASLAPTLWHHYRWWQVGP